MYERWESLSSGKNEIKYGFTLREDEKIRGHVQQQKKSKMRSKLFIFL